MTGARKGMGLAAALLLMATLSAAPAKAQLGGFGGAGGEDMMTQMAPMLEMMKAKMGKKRFGMLMKTMGPMMSRMMENGGFGGMGMGGMGMGMGMGGFGGGMMPAGFSGYTPDSLGVSPGLGGGGFMGMGGGEMMAMIPELMQLANTGGGKRRARRR